MRRFMNSIEAPLLDLQEKLLLEFEGLSYTLYYRPIIKTIKALLNKSDIIKELILSYQEKTINEVSIEICNLQTENSYFINYVILLRIESDYEFMKTFTIAIGGRK